MWNEIFSLMKISLNQIIRESFLSKKPLPCWISFIGHFSRRKTNLWNYFQLNKRKKIFQKIFIWWLKSSSFSFSKNINWKTFSRSFEHWQELLEQNNSRQWSIWKSTKFSHLFSIWFYSSFLISFEWKEKLPSNISIFIIEKTLVLLMKDFFQIIKHFSFQTENNQTTDRITLGRWRKNHVLNQNKQRGRRCIKK
jgi:hypothetical protein